MSSKYRSTPSNLPNGSTVEDIQSIVNLQTREKFERNALLMEERSMFTVLMKQIIEMPMKRGSGKSSSLPEIFGGSSSAGSRAPVYQTGASSPQTKGGQVDGRYNPHDVVRRDQMAWETYEIRSRELRRQREGADDILTRPDGHRNKESRRSDSTPPRSPRTTDSVPTDAQEFEDDALFAARNLRLMHARRRRAENLVNPPTSPPPSKEPKPSASSPLPPLNARASTPTSNNLLARPATPQDKLPSIASPDARRLSDTSRDILAALGKEEGFNRSTILLEEQASRSQTERKYSLYAKVAYLKTTEREEAYSVPQSSSNIIPPPATIFQNNRPEVMKQFLAMQKEEMASRVMLSDDEAKARGTIASKEKELLSIVKERSHRLHKATEVSSTTERDTAHLKAIQVVEARRQAHIKTLDTARRLIIDEEGLERDDLEQDWEETLTLNIGYPYWSQLANFLMIDEATWRGSLSREQDRAFARDTAALRKYLTYVEPFVQMHWIECEEILKHSYSAIQLLTGVARNRAITSSHETARRQEVIDVEIEVRNTMMQHANRLVGFSKQNKAVFDFFTVSAGLFALTEMETVRRGIIRANFTTSLMALLDSQQSHVEAGGRFAEWRNTTFEIFIMEQDRRKLLYEIASHAVREKSLLKQETNSRLVILDSELALRGITRVCEAQLLVQVELLDDARSIVEKYFTSSRHEVFHQSSRFKSLPIEIQEAAKRVRDKDPTFDRFEVRDASAYTSGDFIKLLDILKNSPNPMQKISVRMGSTHAMSLYEINPVELELIQCGVEDIDGSSIEFLEFLSEPTCRMQSLVLDGNDLTDLTIRKFLRVLKFKNHKIRRLALADNVDIPPNLMHAVQYLVELNHYSTVFKALMVRAQENDPTVREIDLASYVPLNGNIDQDGKLSPIGDAAVRLLCLSLQSNTHCTSISVGFFGMTEVGARHIATLLRNNTSVKRIDVSNNLIGMSGVALLTQAAAGAPQRPVIVFSNNFTIAEVEREEIISRKSVSRFEEFQRGFVTAFADVSEGRVVRLAQYYEKKVQGFSKFEAPVVRRKLLDEIQNRQRIDLGDDETVVRNLISDRFDDSWDKLNAYISQRIREVERFSRDRSMLLLYHTVLLEQETERALQVTIIEKVMRRQALLDAEFYFRYMKKAEEQHESAIGVMQVHYTECMNFYIKSDGLVQKLAESLMRQPQAIREVIFNEKLKLMQRLEPVPTPRVAASSPQRSTTMGSASIENSFASLLVAPSTTAVTPAPAAVMVTAVQRTVSPVLSQSPERRVSPISDPAPSRHTPVRNSILTTTKGQGVTESQVLASSTSSLPAVGSSSPLRRSVEVKPKLQSTSIVPGLLSAPGMPRDSKEDDFPVTDETIALMHEIICTSLTPIDRLNLSYKCSQVNFEQSMPLLEEMSVYLDALDLSGCGLTDAYVPSIIDMMTRNDSSLMLLSVKDNNFTKDGMRQMVMALQHPGPNLLEFHFGNDDDAVQETSFTRRLRDLAKFYLAMRGNRAGRFKKLLIDVEADHSFVRVLDFSNTILTKRRKRESSHKKLRKTGKASPKHPRDRMTPSTNLGSSVEDYSEPGESDSNERSASRGPAGSNRFASGGSASEGVLTEIDDLDDGILSENVQDVPPALDDESVQLICFALQQNHHVRTLSLRGNNISENGGKRLLKYLREYGDVTPLEWVDIRDNFIPEEIADEIDSFFTKLWAKRFEEKVIAQEKLERDKLMASMQYDECFVPIGKAALHRLRQFALQEEQWYAVHSEVYDFFVAKGMIDLAVVDPEVAHRKVREHVFALFAEKARVYLMLLNYRSEKYLKYCAQKEQLFKEEEVMTMKVGKMILALDPNLQAVAVHIARNNKFVDSLDLSSTPLEPKCSDEIISIMSGLMKQNTFVKEVSLANSGGYFNTHRSIPLVAEMGLRLESLDLTNCHLTDAHVGSLAVMLQSEDCQLETLVLDENYITSVGARKLAKSIRNSKLSCVSISRNSNMALEDQKLIQFYCDLNKYTPQFKNIILRVEANDPTLTELHFDRKGNLDERSVFDDVSMRLLCAALPHNTHVERIYVQGNHVTDEGALCLLNLLKAKVNRSVYVADLSGNDVSPALVDELAKLVLIRLSETIDHTVFNPEDIARTTTLHEDKNFYFHITRLKNFAKQWSELKASIEGEKTEFLERMFYKQDLDFQVFQHERRWRQIIEEEEKRFADVSVYVHDAVVRGYQPIVLDFMRSMRRVFMSAQQEMEDLLDELERQPNLDLRRHALWILNNMRNIELLDLSSTLPSDFCEQEVLCNGRTVDLALRVLSKNKTVKKMSFANNAGHIPIWGDIWPLSRRMESLDFSRCGLTDMDVPHICQIISDPLCTLKELILDGNLFSEVGCMDILRTLRHNMETRPNFPIKLISLKECPHVSESLLQAIEFLSDLLKCTPQFRELMIRLKFDSDGMTTVDAQGMEINDEHCRLLCHAIKGHKTIRTIKLRRNLITDIGVDYLVRLVKANPPIEFVDITENDVSSVARRQLASLLEERLGRRIGNDVELPEEFHREDIIYEESLIPKFFFYYNRLARSVFEHYKKDVDMYVEFGARIWGARYIFGPEQEARHNGLESDELQQRLLLYKWMQYHQWIVSFGERTTKQKKQWLDEGNGAIRELATLVNVHPSRELREKAFRLALNAPSVTSLSLVQLCDENAVVILGKVLKGNTYCKELNLSGNHQIKPSWVLPIVAEANTEIESINLSDCNLRDPDIADPLRNLLGHPRSKLLRVTLDRNFCTQATVQRIVPVIRDSNHKILEIGFKHNPELNRVPLHYLDFCLELNRYIAVGHEHGKQEDYIGIKNLLIEVEANKPHISTLNFVNDQYALLMLDDQFAKLVCIALAHNSHVRTLYIRGHQVTDKGANYILQVMQGVNRTLDYVDLHGNFVSDSMLLALEYAVPWRLYATDLDRLLNDGQQEHQAAYNAYEAYFYTCKKEHQLYIFNPSFDARVDIEKDEDMAYRKLLSRYPEWLRFADAWHKSYKYAFQRTFLQAEETLPLMDQSSVNFETKLSKNVISALSPKKSGVGSKLLDAVSTLKAQMLPDALRQKYLKFVSLVDLYEQKCVRALEKVFIAASPNADAAEALLSQEYSPSKLKSIIINNRTVSPPNDTPLARALSSGGSTPKPLFGSFGALNQSTDFSSPGLGRAKSPSVGQRALSPFSSFASPDLRSSSPNLRSSSFNQSNNNFLSVDQFSDMGSSLKLNRAPSFGNFESSFVANTSPNNSQFFSSSQFADISGIDEEKLLMKLVARYERLFEQVLTYEGKCAQLIQTQFRQAANQLAFVGKNRKIHGENCDDRCICAIKETNIDRARKLHDRLTLRFQKYATQVTSFEDVCMSTIAAYYDESRLAILEKKKLLLKKSQAELDAIKLLYSKLENRYERYVSTVDDFENKCFAALQKAFELHSAPVERAIEDAVMRKQAVDEKLAEAAELHQKLYQRYVRYESVMGDFETKCRGAKERLVKPDFEAASQRRESVGSRERQGKTVVFIEGEEAASPGLLSVKSFFSAPKKIDPQAVKLQARFDKYKQQVDEFSEQCFNLYEATFLREKSKLETGSTQSFRRSGSMFAKDQAAAADVLNRAPSLRRVDSMAAIVSPDEKTEQALQLLPTQPMALQRVGRLIANNDPSVIGLDLSSVSDPKPVSDTTVGILFTLLRSNNCLKNLSLANHAHHLTITSMKLLSRLGRKLESLDLSNGMMENSLLAPTICSMLSVPECTVNTLNLDNNKLTQEGALQIMQVMRRSNNSLTSISLVGNQDIEKASLSFLNFYCDLNKFTEVDSNFKTTVISIEKNEVSTSQVLLKNAGYVDDLAVRCLCVGLARNTNVTVVNLSGNAITDKSVKHIVQLLGINKSVIRMDLSNNKFTQDGVSALRRAASDSAVQAFIV